MACTRLTDLSEALRDAQAAFVHDANAGFTRVSGVLNACAIETAGSDAGKHGKHAPLIG